MQDYSRSLAWNADYSISLEVDGRVRTFSQLSGGEQMSAALSVRLALLREMSSIDIAFFDEPTANLDEPRREALARQILNVRGFRQLFVISHDDTFEQATQNLIRVARIDGASRIMSA
jgi:exonuclease SbcC